MDPVVIIGMGQLGGVFARGLLRLGHPVFPVLRDQPLDKSEAPELVLVAVGEKDLDPVLAGLPPAWRSHVGLIQNELLPSAWERRNLADPTVMTVWFEKRKTFEARVLRPSPVFGPKAELLAAALEAMELPARVLEDRAALVFELVVKNVYILTKNVAGLAVGGTGGSLFIEHGTLARSIAEEVLRLQSALLGDEAPNLDPDRIAAEVRAGFESSPEQANRGRSAPDRLRRALSQAKELEIHMPVLERLADEHL